MRGGQKFLIGLAATKLSHGKANLSAAPTWRSGLAARCQSVRQKCGKGSLQSIIHLLSYGSAGASTGQPERRCSQVSRWRRSPCVELELPDCLPAAPFLVLPAAD